MIYEIQSLVVVAFLAACWGCELVAPAVCLAWRETLASRCRHLALGAINAVPAIAIAFALGGVDAHAAASEIGLFHRAGLPAWCTAVAAFLVLDCCQYAEHVLMHKTPLLWRIHAVHHHADHVESTTAFRFHALEVVAHGLLLAPLMLVLGIRVHDLALYNAIVVPMSLFHHANTRLPRRLERILRLLIITPDFHRLHHARWQPLTDSNYGAILTLWDRVFGTASAHPHPEAVPVGLDGFDRDQIDSLRGMLGTPFSSSRAGPGTPPTGVVPPKPKTRAHRRKTPCNRSSDVRV